MAFDKNFAINVMYPLANAAYLVMNTPTPPLALPTGFALSGLIQANALQAGFAMAAADPDHQRLANLMVSESSVFGLLAWNNSTHTAIVAIRGTKTIWDWIADIDAVPIRNLPDPSAGFVHMGFQLVYEHIRVSVADLLKTNCQGAQAIWVTGLGGVGYSQDRKTRACASALYVRRTKNRRARLRKQFQDCYSKLQSCGQLHGCRAASTLASSLRARRAGDTREWRFSTA